LLILLCFMFVIYIFLDTRQRILLMTSNKLFWWCHVEVKNVIRSMKKSFKQSGRRLFYVWLPTSTACIVFSCLNSSLYSSDWHLLLVSCIHVHIQTVSTFEIFFILLVSFYRTILISTWCWSLLEVARCSRIYEG